MCKSKFSKTQIFKNLKEAIVIVGVEELIYQHSLS